MILTLEPDGMHTSGEMNVQEKKTVLAIGGLDPSGGAGILADAGAIGSLGLHCAAVCAVRTVQDGVSFSSAAAQDIPLIVAEIKSIFEHQQVRAVKIGALGNSRIVIAIGRLMLDSGLPIVVDPVIRSTSGGELLDDDGVTAMRDHLIPMAALVTPNLAEASELCGISVGTVEDMTEAARIVLRLGARAVLIKGGHLDGSRVVDVFASNESGAVIFENDRLDVGEVRGTGCALASLIAARLGCGVKMREAVEGAREILRGAMARSVKTGAGPRVLSFIDR
jgi:hydroxymethylpyrimidine/phosphomethylpyrimidine kinase